ncbi:EF-hand domain-containing protein [Pseudoxanthomonas taiwanensis]|nr:EF-hand domain-containing protein [Pseudoxanthomonas taiwanensis]
MKKTPTLIAAALMAVVSGTVLAQAQGGKPALDANKDGVIDRQEAAAFPRLAERFDQLDRNKDGKLDRDEMPRPPRHARHGHRGPHGFGPMAPFAGADKDGDGRVSRAEALAAATARFERMDVNKDGFIDEADRKAMREQWREAWFKKVDTDGDGKLSREELDAAKARHGHGPMREHAPAAK